MSSHNPKSVYQNLELHLHQMHKNIRPDLLRSLERSKQSTKISEIIDTKTLNKLENDIHSFVLECRKRNKRNLLPAIHQVISQGIEY